MADREERQLDTNQTTRELIRNVDAETMSESLFHLAKDPLPFRKLNFTLPGHEKNALYEADDYLAGKLESWGYATEREGCQVQAILAAIVTVDRGAS